MSSRFERVVDPCFAVLCICVIKDIYIISISIIKDTIKAGRKTTKAIYIISISIIKDIILW